jgi:hypothetical protein
MTCTSLPVPSIPLVVLQTGPTGFVTVEMYIIPVVAFLLGLVLQVGETRAAGVRMHHLG